jgi:hypothetical protein
MYCQNCNLKKNCKEVCVKLSKYLARQGIYSADYIRKSRETPFSHKKIDHISSKQAFKLRYGHTPKSPESDNSEEDFD